MAEQTGQITVLKNNTVTNVEHQIRFIFTKNNGERITRDTTSKGVINFDIPNGDWNVSWFAVDGDQKVLPLRAGLQLKITSSTPPTALADWIYGDNTHVADPILAQWTTVLDEMKAVRDQFRDETQQDGTGKFVMQSSVKRNSLRNAGGYYTSSNTSNIDSWSAGDSGLLANVTDNIPQDVRSLFFDSFIHVETQGIYSANLSNKWQIVRGYRRPEIVIRQYTPGSDSGWTSAKLYSTYNTTVDSNGNLKAASPVIKLFDDRIEHSGFGDNEPVFEKLYTGVYKISNTLGLAKEGWYIETPKDKNGLPYFMVDWEQDEETYDVIIRVFKKKLDLETLDFINGDPIDIGEDQRWIDLRFHEEPQQEAEMLVEMEAEHKEE